MAQVETTRGNLKGIDAVDFDVGQLKEKLGTGLDHRHTLKKGPLHRKLNQLFGLEGTQEKYAIGLSKMIAKEAKSIEEGGSL